MTTRHSRVPTGAGGRGGSRSSSRSRGLIGIRPAGLATVERSIGQSCSSAACPARVSEVMALERLRSHDTHTSRKTGVSLQLGAARGLAGDPARCRACWPGPFPSVLPGLGEPGASLPPTRPPILTLSLTVRRTQTQCTPLPPVSLRVDQDSGQAGTATGSSAPEPQVLDAAAHVVNLLLEDVLRGAESRQGLRLPVGGGGGGHTICDVVNGKVALGAPSSGTDERQCLRKGCPPCRGFLGVRR